MPRESLSPVERLARKICKVLSDSPRLERGRLQEFVLQDARIDQSRRGTQWSRKTAWRDGDFELALSLAVSSGWIRLRDDGLVLTELGRDLARHSRVGRMRRRTDFL